MTKNPSSKNTSLSPGTKRENEHLYRPGVGLMLLNQHGDVFIGERIDNPGSWQMPQGGIDEGEDVTLAVFREMHEEIGTKDACIMGVMDNWLYYDLPERTAKKMWEGQYIGQRQKWIALEFLGDDSDIDLKLHSHPEFKRWKWVPIDHLIDYAVTFKREVYKIVISEFYKYALEIARRKPRD